MQSETNWLPVGQAGVIRLEIPVHTLGSGQPVLGVTCSVHGDEHAGLFIASRLIEYLNADERLNGTIHIISAANPAAQFVNSRVSSLDQKDLNRGGRGRREGSFTDRVGAQLFNFLSRCDIVVNIHEFEMHTPTTAVFMNAGSLETKIKTLEAMRAFSPEIIWVIDTSQNGDVQYQATLDTALAQASVVNFPIETTQLAFLTESEIDKVAQGLKQVATHLGIIQASNESPSAIAPAYVREEVTSNDAGLWEPSVQIMREINIGDVIGTLQKLPDFQKQIIKSPSRGILVQCRHRQLVSTGTSLFSIGHNAEEFITPYM